MQCFSQCITTTQTSLQHNKRPFKRNQTQDTSDSLSYLRCPPEQQLQPALFDAPSSARLRGAQRRAGLDPRTRGPPGGRCRPQARPETEARPAAAAASLPLRSAKATWESHNRQSTIVLHLPDTRPNNRGPAAAAHRALTKWRRKDRLSHAARQGACALTPPET